MPRIRRKNNRKHPTENKCEKRCAIYFHEFYFGVVWFNMANGDGGEWENAAKKNTKPTQDETNVSVRACFKSSRQFSRLARSNNIIDPNTHSTRLAYHFFHFAEEIHLLQRLILSCAAVCRASQIGCLLTTFAKHNSMRNFTKWKTRTAQTDSNTHIEIVDRVTRISRSIEDEN